MKHYGELIVRFYNVMKYILDKVNILLCYNNLYANSSFLFVITEFKINAKVIHDLKCLVLVPSALK